MVKARQRSQPPPRHFRSFPVIGKKDITTSSTQHVGCQITVQGRANNRAPPYGRSPIFIPPQGYMPCRQQRAKPIYRRGTIESHCTKRTSSPSEDRSPAGMESQPLCRSPPSTGQRAQPITDQAVLVTPPFRTPVQLVHQPERARRYPNTKRCSPISSAAA
jgi:hypothetical protein